MKKAIFTALAMVLFSGLFAQDLKQLYCDSFNATAGDKMSSTYQNDTFIIIAEVPNSVTAKKLFDAFKASDIKNGKWETNLKAMKTAGFKKQAVMTTWGYTYTYTFPKD